MYIMHIYSVFSLTAFSDPGIIYVQSSKKNDPDPDVENALLANSNHHSHKKPEGDIPCGVCDVLRSSTASHCNICKVCMDEVDHHCPVSTVLVISLYIWYDNMFRIYIVDWEMYCKTEYVLFPIKYPSKR